MRFRCILLVIRCLCLAVAFSTATARGQIVFPDQLWPREHQFPEPRQWFEPRVAKSTPKGIPLSLALRLNGVEDENQFLEKFVKNGSKLFSSRADDLAGVSFRAGPFGGDSSSSNAVRNPPRPKFAACRPEPQVVTVRENDDPNEFYFPSCIRIERCGGCCNHELLACQPTQTESVNYTIHVTKYVGQQQLTHTGQRVFAVERHLKCACGCKLKPQDCTPQQKYQKDDCNCVCTNKQDERSCSQDGRKLWNPLSCSCQCRERYDCTTGFGFDMSTCNCVRVQERPLGLPDYGYIG